MSLTPLSALSMWAQTCASTAVLLLFCRWVKGWYRSAKALQGLGRFEAAAQAASKALQLEPTNKEVRRQHLGTPSLLSCKCCAEALLKHDRTYVLLLVHEIGVLWHRASKPCE
jgi:hypothetical protein